jgi:Zn-dependent peptidase ImmA (M78 family)/plasmid maintenance system antidote protein VapI
MNESVDFLPNWYSLPGNTITDILKEKNISVIKLAENMGDTMSYVEQLIAGQISINHDIAEKLEINLGATTDFWINRERQYQETLARLEQTNWLNSLPIAEMLKFGWIKKVDDMVKACLDFFDVPDISSWKEKYEFEVGNLAFRTSQTYTSEQGAIAAWLRKGELETNSYDCKPWNLDLFTQKLDEIKSLTRKKSPKYFLPKLIELCKECGVAVAIVPSPKGCKASGATKFISSDRALLLLSFRYLSDDHFWFTFFHEAGHLVLHNHKSTFIEIDSNKTINDIEKEANSFAAEMLVPYKLHSQLNKLKGNQRNILNFAMENNISPGIVVGQMQYLGIIDYRYLNSYKRRYDWNEIFE